MQTKAKRIKDKTRLNLIIEVENAEIQGPDYAKLAFPVMFILLL